MTRHDLIAAALPGADEGGLVYAAGLDALHQGLHLCVIPHLEGVILKGVELRQVKVDDLLLDGTGGVPGLGGLFRRRWFGLHGRGGLTATQSAGILLFSRS